MTFSTAQLTKSLINGIDTLSSDEWVAFYEELFKKCSAEHVEDIQYIAMDTQESLEERLKYDAENSQDYICEKYCLSIYQGLIEENVGNVYPCA